MTIVRDPWDKEWSESDAPSIECTCTERTEIGRLLGPDGKTLRSVQDRRSVAFGFQPKSRHQAKEVQS